MITFTLCLLALIVGYFTYGRLMERVFGPDDRKTPALTKADGVNSVVLLIYGLCWEVFLPGRCTIILPECFPCVMRVRVCRKLSDAIWDLRRNR